MDDSMMTMAKVTLMPCHACMDYAKGILHLEKKTSGATLHARVNVLLTQFTCLSSSQNSRITNLYEFLAFSNYYKVFSFLAVPAREREPQ
jgi:hypothetical protein